MTEQPQLVPKDFTTDEYNKLKEAWAVSPKGQAIIKAGSEQDAWYYENETWRYVFEADGYKDTFFDTRTGRYQHKTWASLPEMRSFVAKK